MASGTHKWTLYALELEQGKWFVDATTGDPEAQFKKHKSGQGTAWTSRFAPVRVAYSHEVGDVNEEDILKYVGKLLKKYMDHYGEGNVRAADLPSTRQTKQKYTKQKQGFTFWNLTTQIILIMILLGIIGYLLLDKFYLTPSTALTIVQ